MQLLEDGLIAFLASAGLAAVILLAAAALARPRGRWAEGAVAVVPCRGGAEQLEQTVRALERLRGACGCFSRIVILDRGLDGEAKRVAALLCRGGCGVMLCTEAELAERMGEEYGGTVDRDRHGADRDLSE